MQAQYEQHQDSADQVLQDGTYLNQDCFLVRRGRLRFDAAWEHVELAVEVDANTVNGPAFGPRRVNASIVWEGYPWDGKLLPRGPREDNVPLARLTAGLTGIPFGLELADSPRDRVFLERSSASQAFFPGEQDVGMVLTGGAGFFRYSIAEMNGDPLSDGVGPGGRPHPRQGRPRAIGRRRASERPALGSRRRLGSYGTGFHAGPPRRRQARSGSTPTKTG